MEKQINYMGNLWYEQEEEIYTVGLNEDGLEDIGDIVSVDMPKENDYVNADEVCATIETEDGSLDVYSPIDGVIFEINGSLLENPNLIKEDPRGEGWIVKVSAEESHDDEDEDDIDEDDDSESEDED